jgi:hypothetical protein
MTGPGVEAIRLLVRFGYFLAAEADAVADANRGRCFMEPLMFERMIGSADREVLAKSETAASTGPVESGSPPH